MKKLLIPLSAILIICLCSVTVFAHSGNDNYIDTETWIWLIIGSLVGTVFMFFLIRDLCKQNRFLDTSLNQLKNDKYKLEKELTELSKQNKLLLKDLKFAKDALQEYQQDLKNANDRIRYLNGLNNVGDKISSYLERFQSISEYTIAIDDAYEVSRIGRGLSINRNDISDINVSARIKSESSSEIYDTTLSSCTCVDWHRNHRPCKHMYALASYVGVLGCSNTEELINKLKELSELSENIEREREGINKIIKSKSQRFPSLAKMFDKYYSDLDEYRRNALLVKKQPALKAADTVRQISREKRALGEKCRSLDYQLTYLKTLFPWIEEFVDTPPFDSAGEDLTDENDGSINQSDDYISVRRWLSVDEYKKLSTAEKYQLALDRYVSRKDKSKWDIGIEYEQYVGYLCETHGCTVEYSGAVNGLDDMGRDLIAKINGSVYVIQCKRWHDSKAIHEKHIFQLFGSVTLFKHEFPTADCHGVFITTTTLSQRAADIADSLNIIVYQNFAFDDAYPRIKCNNSKSGEKIYHLPFDQQYNSIKIEHNRGECYSRTTSDAEALGFRKALRHTMNTSNT